jgi:hypothetical protein
MILCAVKEGGQLPNRGRTTIGSQLSVIVRSVGSIQQSLARLIPLIDASQRGGAVSGRTTPPVNNGAGTAPRRKLNLSPERKIALKLQGQYMGYLRGLRPREQAKVKALAAQKGVKVAVRLARQLAKA